MSEDALKVAEIAAEIWRLKYLKAKDEVAVQEKRFVEHQEAWKENNHYHATEIERLRKAVLEEREACARLCEDERDLWIRNQIRDTAAALAFTAQAIRARGGAE